MSWWPATPEARFRAGTLAILVIGFSSALAIYMTARTPPGNPFGYEPEDTKKYVRDMELYAGKANLIASDFRRWFVSLWHGRRLAFTVAGLTVVAACVFMFFAAPLPPDPEADRVNGQNPEGTG